MVAPYEEPFLRVRYRGLKFGLENARSEYLVSKVHSQIMRLRHPLKEYNMLPWHRQLKPFQRLQRYWLKTGADVRTTALSENVVAAMEQKYGVRFPEDFREYLLQSCPVNHKRDNMDEELTSWWSLDRIKNIPEENEHKILNDLVARDASKYLFFADYMIWCWAWAIACGDDENRGRVVVVNGVSDHFAADSFGQFVDRYIKDVHSVA